MLISLLLIEDDPEFETIVEAKLSRPGTAIHFEMHRERTLAGALAYLRLSRVDLVIADLGLPDSQGPEIVRKLIGVSPDTPYLVLSAEDGDSAMWEAICCGAEDYLVKPELTTQSLVVAILNAITQNVARTMGIRMSPVNFAAKPLSAALTIHGFQQQ